MNIKTKKILSLIGIFSSGILLANDTTSHTFFSVRPQFQGAMPEKISLTYDRLHARECGIAGALEIVPFGGASVNGKALAKFFLPFDKRCIIAGEWGSEAVLDDTVDILANYFGVLTRPVSEVFGTGTLVDTNLTFQSLITLNPTQSVAGVGLAYRQKVNKCPERDIWLQVSFPIMNVKNHLGYKEKVINSGGGEVQTGFVGTVGDALRGQAVFGDHHFIYGKIYDCPKSKFGVADIEIILGFEKVRCEIFDRMWYGGIVIPTGNTPNGEYIWEPIVGNNHHWGLECGGEYRYQVWAHCEHDTSLWWHSLGHSQYLFTNTQRRSLDLKDKSWSRYIWLYTQQLPTFDILSITPGINVLTQKVRVSPRSNFNANTSVILKHCAFTAEAGYNTYYRQEEEVKLLHCFDEQAMIVGINEGNTTQFVTESNATMPHFLLSGPQDIHFDTEAATGAPRIVRITQADLNLSSAAHPCIVSHILYFTAAYQWDEEHVRYPTLLAAGGSYEFGSDNVVLDRWLIWGKLEFSF